MKKMMMLVGIALGLSAFSLGTQADPAPFGLVLNKTRVQELKSKFSATSIGINKNNGMEAFDIEAKSLHFEGLIAAKAGFSNDGILKWLQLSLPANRFEEILEGLTKKYSLVYKNLPYEGNKEAKLEEGDTYILLYAQKNSTEMDFIYINKKILEETLQAQTPQMSENALKKPIEISQL